MKKFLIVFLMMVVVLAGVFAADPDANQAQLKVTTSVNAIEPTFRLVAGAANGTVYDDLGGGAGVTTYNITADLTAVEQVEVTFYVNQISKSKSVKTYTLSAGATDLVLYRYQLPNGTWQNVSGEGGVAHPATDAEKKFTVKATTVNTFANGDLTEAKATYAGDSTTKTITYLGNAVPANEGSPVTVAKFTCTWQKNADAVTGDYEATVTLTIAST